MDTKTAFRAMLTERQRSIGSCVCVGLDPRFDKMPGYYKADHRSAEQDIYFWMADVVEKTAPFASMYKPNSAYWEVLPNGAAWLKKLISFIHDEYPGIAVLLDGKRGDISRTQEMYREAHLNEAGQNADGITFSPYMGMDTMEALVDVINPASKGLAGLCYTSNPKARQIQDARMADGRPSWVHYAEWIWNWASLLKVGSSAGLVMAAAYEESKGSGVIFADHLSRCREIVDNKLWFLIPGVGAQGGFVEQTVKAAWAGFGSIAINSSSGITEAADPAAAARDLRDQINAAISLMGYID